MPMNLQSLMNALANDPGLRASIPETQMQNGMAAAQSLVDVLRMSIHQTGVNADGLISPEDMQAISDWLWLPANAQPWREFWLAHGNDSGTVETGYHLLQGDGGTLEFDGLNFVDTVADAIFHYGFAIEGDRYVNEDGNLNQTLADVAGWLNYFLNGRTVVWGTDGDDGLGSGEYSARFGGAANETYFGGAGNDGIWAGEGDDIVKGGTGDDQSGGGLGNDRLLGEEGNDRLWGEEGRDRLNGALGDDLLGGGAGKDLAYGGDGNDSLSGDAGLDHLYGGAGSDVVYGGDLRDLLSGGAGDDYLDGGSGNDRLTGEAGNDTLAGGEGADTIIGGHGADMIKLWETTAMTDVIVFVPGDSGMTADSIDEVQGFQKGVDKIDLTAFGSLVLAGLDFVGGGQGSVRYDGQYLRIDADGDRATDMLVKFAWIDSLVATDFILG